MNWNVIRDRAALIACALVAFFLAWLFWSQLAQHAFKVFSLFVLLMLMWQNARLRSRIRELERRQ